MILKSSLLNCFSAMPHKYLRDQRRIVEDMDRLIEAGVPQRTVWLDKIPNMIGPFIGKAFDLANGDVEVFVQT